MIVDLRGDVKDLIKDLDSHSHKIIGPSTVAALNRTLSQVTTQARRQISKDVGIPQKHIRSRIKIIKATWRNPVATVIALTAGIPYFRLGTAKWRGKQGFFKSTMKSGHEGVFKRRGKPRLKIDEQRLDIKPSAERIIGKLIGTFATEKFRERFEHEMARRLRSR